MSHLEELPLVAIVLVNWNSYVDTLECVDSIQSSTYKNIKIIVVDNGSVDDSVNQLRKRDTEYHLILSRENTGFTGGNNQGIAYAMNIGADYILMLNNDTLIENTAVEKLVIAAQSDMTVGVVTPKILFHPDRHLIWSAGTRFEQNILMGRNRGYRSLDGDEFNQQMYLDYAVGCALLIRREVIDKIGSLTEDYFATWEDVDFGLRISRGGYKVLYEPSAVVWHKESVSAGGADNPQYVYYQTRSALVFQCRWTQSIFNSLRAATYYLTYCLLRSYRFLLAGNIRGIVAIGIAFSDAVCGRLGRRDYAILKRRKKLTRNIASH